MLCRHSNGVQCVSKENLTDSKNKHLWLFRQNKLSSEFLYFVNESKYFKYCALLTAALFPTCLGRDNRSMNCSRQLKQIIVCAARSGDLGHRHRIFQNYATIETLTRPSSDQSVITKRSGLRNRKVI